MLFEQLNANGHVHNKHNKSSDRCIFYHRDDFSFSESYQRSHVSASNLFVLDGFSFLDVRVERVVE